MQPTASSALSDPPATDQQLSEQAAQVEAALTNWATKLPAEVFDNPQAFWARASTELRPLTADTAFMLGATLMATHPHAAQTAFSFAAQNGLVEAQLGIAVCQLWSGQASDAEALLHQFFENKPGWRLGAERVFEPLMRGLFLSGHDLPATLRRQIFEYAFVAFRQGAFFRRDSTLTNVAELRQWFMSGLPSAQQPQVSVPMTLLMGASTLAVISVLAVVAVKGYVPLLVVLLPFSAAIVKVFRESRSRKRLRLCLQAAWAAGDR